MGRFGRRFGWNFCRASNLSSWMFSLPKVGEDSVTSMKNKSFGHLKTRLFTIKPSKHVGFGAQWFSLSPAVFSRTFLVAQAHHWSGPVMHAVTAPWLSCWPVYRYGWSTNSLLMYLPPEMRSYASGFINHWFLNEAGYYTISGGGGYVARGGRLISHDIMQCLLFMQTENLHCAYRCLVMRWDQQPGWSYSVLNGPRKGLQQGGGDSHLSKII